MEFPPKEAVSEWLPTDRADVPKSAIPLPIEEVAPNRLAPSKNDTVPVASAGVKVAVKNTFWPITEGLGVAANAMVVGAGLTTRVTCV